MQAKPQSMKGSAMLRPILFALTLAALLAGPSAYAQDSAAGEKVFNKCRACHQIGENARNGVGPKLNGLIGRNSGSVEGYSYSDANKNSGLTWDEATFRDYIKNPRAKMPGTKMVFVGLQNETEIDNLIAYLKEFSADGKRQ